MIEEWIECILFVFVLFNRTILRYCTNEFTVKFSLNLYWFLLFIPWNHFATSYLKPISFVILFIIIGLTHKHTFCLKVSFLLLCYDWYFYVSLLKFLWKKKYNSKFVIYEYLSQVYFICSRLSRIHNCVWFKNKHS